MSDLKFEDLPSAACRNAAISAKGLDLQTLTDAIWESNEEPRIDASTRAAILLGDYKKAGILEHKDGAWRKKK